MSLLKDGHGCVRHLGKTGKERAKACQFGQRYQGSIGQPRARNVERVERLEPDELGDPGIGDAGVLQIELHKRCHSAERLHRRVAHASVPEIQIGEFVEARQMRETLITDTRFSQVEEHQVGELGKV